MSEEKIELNEDLTQDLPGQEEVEQEEVAEIEQPEEKPKSGFIDYDLIENEEVRETVKMRNNADFRKLKEAERKQAEYEKRLKEYEEKLAEINKPREVQPPTPDDFYNDPDRATQQLQDYNKYVAENAQWSQQEQMRRQQLEAENARLMAERQESFKKKTQSAGISDYELGYAASVVAPQLGDEVQAYLMDHDYGPQILMQLAKNPMELQELASLNPYQVGVKLDKIAKAFKPTKVTKAPPPDDPIQGSGVDPRDDYPILKGAKFL